MLLVHHPTLFVGGALLGQAAFGVLRDERGVVAGVGSHRAILDMQDVVDDGGEKGAIMADQHHRGRGVSQVLLEPLCRLEIEMVGGLIEQQDVARHHELAGEAKPPALSPRQRGQWTCAGLDGIEAQSVQHGVHARGDGVPAVPFESLEVVPVARHRAFAGILTECDRLFGQ